MWSADGWTSALCRDLARYPELVLLGDFNIAPANQNVYAPEKWREKILCSNEERQWFTALLELEFFPF